MKRFLMFLMFVTVVSVASAKVEVRQYENAQQEQRYKHLIDELRCLVCQNQNLADSNAELAQDLRQQVYKMIMEGKDDTAILDFMVTRYGDFVLYRPPFKMRTALLWLGPFIILGLGFIVLIFFIRNRNKNRVSEMSENDRVKVNQLLNDNSGAQEK